MRLGPAVQGYACGSGCCAMSDDANYEQLWEVGPRAHVAANFDFVHEKGQMQVLLKQEAWQDLSVSVMDD